LPITRKVTPVGESRGITFPKNWLEMEEQKHGKMIKVSIEEKDGSLLITPIFEKPEKETSSCQE
jgi:antitoxin component of MazEF toxin-antitoxin module